MIHGFFHPDFPTRPRPFISARLTIPGITSEAVTADFLLDTGAGRTCLHPRDAHLRLGIDPLRLADPSSWPGVTSLGGIGGSATYYEMPVEYGFLHDDRRLVIIPGRILIAQLRPDNQRLPSLLGWDLLQYFRVTVDWPGRAITLDQSGPLPPGAMTRLL